MNKVADYIKWDKAVDLIDRLERAGDYRMCLVVAFGCYWGLRIGETLSLQWKDIYCKDKLIITAEKTKGLKTRDIEINSKLKNLIQRVFNAMKIKNLNEFVFVNPGTGKPFTPRGINIKLKGLNQRYNLNVDRISTHSLRKTFGRKIMQDRDYNNEALHLLSKIFGHMYVGTTQRYLGLTDDEIKSVYLSLI